MKDHGVILKGVNMQTLKVRKSKTHWYPTDYGYEWGGNWLMAGEGRKQVLFGYLHKGGE
tara:strand:- start:1039 stop:1215 length:177 start_codon:yes stop_codon:yes gene_type:complete